MPIACLTTPLRLNAEPSCSRAYIYAKRCPPHETFRPFYERAKKEAGWTACQIDASHSPAITVPHLLMQTLEPLLKE